MQAGSVVDFDRSSVRDEWHMGSSTDKTKLVAFQEPLNGKHWVNQYRSKHVAGHIFSYFMSAQLLTMLRPLLSETQRVLAVDLA
jgi:hypothetical protein